MRNKVLAVLTLIIILTISTMDIADALPAGVNELYTEALFDLLNEEGAAILQVRLIDINQDGLPEMVVDWENPDWQVSSHITLYSVINGSVQVVFTTLPGYTMFW